MAKTNTLRELAQFTALLEATGLDPRCIHQAARNVPKLIMAFEAQPENRAGRRVRKPVRKAVRRTLTHLASAARQVGDGSASRAEARKLIRFASCCDDFAALERRASQYRGQHNKIVRHINDRKVRERARVIWLDDDHSLMEVKTLRHLRSVGKRLRNCIGGHWGEDYRDALLRRRSEFWALRHQGDDVGLLAIDADSRKIEEFGGEANDPVGWEWHLLLELQRELSATGDEINEFIESGAFSLFVNQPNLRPVLVQVGQRAYQVWRSTGELIIRDDHKRWSRFRLFRSWQREYPSCEATCGSALDADELVCLVAVSRELASVVAQSLPETNVEDADDAVGRAPRLPRRRRRHRR